MTDLKNVLFVLNFTSSFEGSFIRSVNALGEELTREGYPPVYLLPEECESSEWAKKLISSGVRVYYFKSSAAAILRNTLLIRKIIKEYDIGIIHSHFANYKIHIPIAAAMWGKKNIDYIVHVNTEQNKKSPLYDRLSAFFTNATLYIAVSDSIKNDLEINGRRAVTVANSVDFSRLEFYDRNVKKSDFITSPEQSIVFMFGRDFESKGVDFVVRSLSEYDKERKLKLLIAVSDSGESIANSIKEIYGDIPDWITLLPPRNDVATYFRLADVFVSANRSQGSPYTMIECAYLGIPMIYCDVPGLSELNIPWAVKISCDDSLSLYKAISEIIKEDKEETLAMGEESKEYAANSFSLGSWVYEIINIYKNIGRI